MTDNKHANLLDVIVVLVISTSIYSLLLLILKSFNVHVSVILGAITTLSVFWMRKSTWKVELGLKSKHALPILMLLLIGCLFRSEPYLYVAGGQDEGVYVNMSQFYENYGKIFITDELRKDLPESLKDAYDSANLRIGVAVKNEKEGNYLPGVYIKSRDNSEYVFQFYQLHPVWMSIFGKLFGDINRVYSLVFFSFLSLVAFYWIAIEFTQRKSLSFLAAVLLAVNPLHAFFSKFPVSEVVALTFTTLSFYYLLKYFNSAKEKDYNPSNLVLSSLLMSGMFFTRISGFMYIPFFYLMLITTQICIDDKKLKKHLEYYVFSIFLLYVISVWYGLVFSYPYSSDIYRTSFQGLLGSNWRGILPFVLGFLAFFYFAVLYVSKRGVRDKLKKYLSSFRNVIPYLFLVILMLGFYKVYQLGFTDKFLGHLWVDSQWKASGKGWLAILYWSVFVLVEYLSPFIAIVFSYILFSQAKSNDAARTMLILFVFLFFCHISLLQWFIPYQYYYARYLLSEILPFALLFTVIGLDRISGYKNTANFLVGLSVVYMLFFTTLQFKGKSMDGLHDSLSEITKFVGQDDILILDKRWFHSAAKAEIKTPLKFYYDLNVLTVNYTDKERFIDYFCKMNSNVYLLGERSNDKYDELIKVVDINAGIFGKTIHIPVSFANYSERHYLSRVSCTVFKRNKFQQSHTLYEKGSPMGEMIGFYDDQVWTKGTSRLTGIDIDVDGNRYLLLETYGWNPYRMDLKKLGLSIFVNGEKLAFYKQVKNKYYFSLPNSQKIQNLDVKSTTFNPSGLGMSQDGRDLGIDIKLIKLVAGVEQDN